MATRIGLREVRALKPGETIWDAALPGLGARRQRGEAIAFILYYRTAQGRQRWYTIGRFGAPWTPETARREAKRLLGAVAGGGDPAAERRAKRNAKTVAELCDLYLADAEAGRLVTRRRVPKKPSTLLTDRGRIAHHIKPLLGRRTVAAVTHGDVKRFMHDVAEGRTAGRHKTGRRGLARVQGGRGTQHTAAVASCLRSSAQRVARRARVYGDAWRRPNDGLSEVLEANRKACKPAGGCNAAYAAA
jgi:Arm DNA-binding domain